MFVVGQKSYRQPELRAKGSCWEPSMSYPGILPGPNPIWSFDKLDGMHRPIVTGVRPSALFSQDCPSVLDMPIKMPGDKEYRLPSELNQFQDLVSKVAGLEHSVNSSIDLCYAYLTIDQGWVNPGDTQRTDGWHVDGFQGARVFPKVESDHSYIVQDKYPTHFSLQDFRLSHLDPEKDNFFWEMDRQALGAPTWRARPYEVLMMDAYTVHKAAVAHEGGFRTFFRLTYSVRQFDRLGNTINPIFNYDWDMVTRDVAKELA